jgi:hypothetical protein
MKCEKMRESGHGRIQASDNPAIDLLGGLLKRGSDGDRVGRTILELVQVPGES